ncbi:hypothetical protein TNCV_2490691 [Trichonephila clavipes]|nr:hypothetical protein TNCV_2490691 [Trichonephila clavipes]
MRLPSRSHIFHVAFSLKTNHPTPLSSSIPDLTSAFSPASLSEKRKGNSIQQLSAANTSPINVYEIVKPPSFSQEVKHNIKHFIETSGPPVFAKARRLAPDRLKLPNLNSSTC